MAKLTPQKKTGGSNETSYPECNTDTLPPDGQHLAVCANVIDYEDVERKVFQSEATKVTSVTRFLFSYTVQGHTHYVETKEMQISTNEKSNLMKFLSSWLGHAPDLSGEWDYVEHQKGQPALLDIAHQPSKMGDRVYVNINNIMPVPEALKNAAQANLVDDVLIEAPADEDPFPGF